MTKRQTILLSLSLVSLLLGCIIYLSFRTTDFLIYHWIGLKTDAGWIRSWQAAVSNYPTCDFIKFSLPDGLWLYSYLTLTELIWDKHNGTEKKIFLTSIPLLAIMTEMLQFLHIYPGTGDWMDVFAYILAILLCLLTLKTLPK